MVKDIPFSAKEKKKTKNSFSKSPRERPYCCTEKAFPARLTVLCPLLSDLERSGLQSKFRGWARLHRGRLQRPGDASMPGYTAGRDKVTSGDEWLLATDAQLRVIDAHARALRTW